MVKKFKVYHVFGMNFLHLKKIKDISNFFQTIKKILYTCSTHMTSPLKNKYKIFHSYLVAKSQQIK